MIDNEKRKTLISYRIDQSRQTIREAEFLINNDMLRGAVNRIYYSMFYILLALALQYKFETSKHQQLIGWFNKNFVYTGKIPSGFSKILQKAYNKRTKSDYDTSGNLTREEVLEMFKEMNSFILRMEQLLKDNV